MTRCSLVLLALAAFFGTARTLRSSIGRSDFDDPTEKLEYFQANHEQYTALAIGASGTLRSYDPRIVDPIVNTVEPDFKSFNLGARGLWSFEADYFLRRALATPGHRIRWVLIEPSSWNPVVKGTRLETHRTQDWHDAYATLGVTRTTLGFAREYPWESAKWTWLHLQWFARRATNYGQIARMVGRLADREPERYLSESILAEGHGYASIGATEPAAAVLRRSDFASDLEGYAKKTAMFAAAPVSPLPLAMLRNHRRQLELLERRGIDVVYFAPPEVVLGTHAESLHASGEAPQMVNLKLPLEYPELYDPEMRLDANHLNADGARLCSRIFGERLVELLRD